MLETLVKKLGRKISTVALVGSLLLNSGCATYKTLSPSSIQPASPISWINGTLLDGALLKVNDDLLSIGKPRDYSKLTYQEAIEYIKTPYQAQDYLNRHFEYINNGGFFIPGFINMSEAGKTFKYLHKKRQGTCFDYAISAAALLSNDGYPPLILAVRRGLTEGHAAFLYREETGYGILGNIPINAKYPSVEDLVKKLQELSERKITGYLIVNLNEKFPNRRWIDGDIDLYKLMPFSKFIKLK